MMADRTSSTSGHQRLVQGKQCYYTIYSVCHFPNPFSIEKHPISLLRPLHSRYSHADVVRSHGAHPPPGIRGCRGFLLGKRRMQRRKPPDAVLRWQSTRGKSNRLSTSGCTYTPAHTPANSPCCILRGGSRLLGGAPIPSICTVPPHLPVLRTYLSSPPARHLASSSSS